MSDLGALRELAQKATPGPWKLSEPQGNWIWPHVCNTYGSSRPDAEFIAAFNPATALALIDALESARSIAGRLEKELADKRADVLAMHVEEAGTSCCATCGHVWPCATSLIFEVDYEAVGGPVNEGDEQ